MKPYHEWTIEEKNASIREYEDQKGNRVPLTVAQLIEVLKGLPQESLVKVSHQPRYHPVGFSDPLPVQNHKIATIVGFSRPGIPMFGDSGFEYVTFE